MEPGYVFKKVPHRASRKLGIQIVIRAPLGGDLRKANPKILHHNIVRADGEVPSRIKFANTGAVTVDVISEAAATRLLATTAVGGVQVGAYLPETCHSEKIPKTRIAVPGHHLGAVDGESLREEES